MLQPVYWTLSTKGREFTITINPDGSCSCFDDDAATQTRQRQNPPLAPELRALANDVQAIAQIDNERQEFSVSLPLPSLIIDRIRNAVASEVLEPEDERYIDELLLPYFKEHVNPFLGTPI